MKYKVNLDVYNDNFEATSFEGLESSEAIYKACKKAVNYCQKQFDTPIIAEIFIEVNGNRVYGGEVRIGIAQNVSVYRMYTMVMDKVSGVLI